MTIGTNHVQCGGNKIKSMAMFCKTSEIFFMVTDRKVPSATEGSEDPGGRDTESLVVL